MTTLPWNHEGIAVELYFDAQAERKIRSFREEMYQGGITPVLGTLDDRPHISLAVFGRTDPEKLVQLSRSFALTLKPFPIQLSAIGVFPTEDNILFLIPAANTVLMTVHAAFHQLLEQERIMSSPYYLPGNWVPHCTIESDVSNPQLKKAVHLGKSLFTPVKGSITELGVVAFRPINYLAEFTFQP